MSKEIQPKYDFLAGISDQQITVNKVQPAVIEFENYDLLKSGIDNLTNSLEGYVVTENSYNKDKKTRADLNRIKKQLKDNENLIVSQVNKPIIDFKDKMKSLRDEIDDTSKQIDKGIKVFDVKAKEQKHADNLAKIAEIAVDNGVSAKDIEYLAKWDNKTTTWKSIETDLKPQIEKLVQDKKVLTENITFITKRAKELGLGASNYINNLMAGQTIIEVSNQLDIAYKEQVAIKKAQEEKQQQIAQAKPEPIVAPQEPVNTETHGNKVIDCETGEVVAQTQEQTNNVFSINQSDVFMSQIAVKTNQAGLENLYRYLDSQNIKYKRII